MKIYKRAILPINFKASAVSCGMKKTSQLDLALLYSSLPARVSCKFTTNRIQAAHIQLNKRHLRNNQGCQAVIVNSGNANSFTGRGGIRDAEEIAQSVARKLRIKKERVLVASTGIIGKRLPLEKIKKGIPELIKKLSERDMDKAKLAIMTTDTFPKEFSVKFSIGKRIITVSGIAKGSGMIAPHLATMLSFILSDANITQKALNKALDIAVGNSFNCITVDGCMSTNDTVILLANGAVGNNLIDEKRNFSKFSQALNTVCLELARLIVRDAEGATKFIRIKVDEARNSGEAKNVALSIANSNLFKTAMYGENPNFGRIVAAVGSVGIVVKEKKLRIKVSLLDKKEINVDVSLGRGKSSAVIYTSDLTPEYIKINAEYN